jgi:23S rRNA pseudouridine1911/1915/1917 synthase
MNPEENLNNEELEFEIKSEDREQYKRLDQFLADKINGYSRTFLKNLFLNDQVVLSDLSPIQNICLELKKMPPIGSIISVQIPPPMPAEAQAENIPLEILYEDEHLLFINKPAGLVTHPAPGNYTGTLVNSILFHCKDLKGVGDQKRPGIVHRLDKGTSGIMVVAKTQSCHEGLVLLFSSHNIERFYEAIVIGNVKHNSGFLESYIGRDPHNRLKMKATTTHGKRAYTNYKVLQSFDRLHHMEFKLETGRTHQIRVHTSELLKLPILGDTIYGNTNEQLMKIAPEYKILFGDYPHPLLHAKILGLTHPITKEKLRFEVPPPKIFKDILTLAKNINGKTTL